MNVSEICRQDIYWKHSLRAKSAFIDRGNLNDLLYDFRSGREIGLLGIDIDRNDYWVLKTIDSVSPAMMVCEYDAAFGDIHSVTILCRVDFQRALADYLFLYFFASLLNKALLNKKLYIRWYEISGKQCFFIGKDLVFPR